MRVKDELDKLRAERDDLRVALRSYQAKWKRSRDRATALYHLNQKHQERMRKLKARIRTLLVES